MNLENFGKRWADYPMGPKLREYLDIEDYQGEQSGAPDAEKATAFSQQLIELFQAKPVGDFYEWVDLLEELCAMGLSSVVTFLAENDYKEQASEDFRAQLAIGSCYMLEGIDEAACQHLLAAYEASPEEIAPYVNLASLQYAFERDKEAKAWAEAGLKVDGEQTKLWEILASILLHDDKASAGEKLSEFAQSIQAYLGLSLAADLIDPNDALLKVQMLEPLADSSNLSAEFIVEYTAALGLAREFEKIPGVLWKAEQIHGLRLPWKAYAHLMQAYLAEEKATEAKQMLEKIKKLPDVPLELLAEFERECESLGDQK